MLILFPADIRLPGHDGQRILSPRLQLCAAISWLFDLQLHVSIRAR